MRIGSRKQERALAAADEIRGKVPTPTWPGFENAEATRAAAGGIVILSVPFEHTASTLKAMRDELAPTGPCSSRWACRSPPPSATWRARVIGVSQGSCAELCRTRSRPTAST